VNPEIQQVLREMGVTQADFQAIQRAPTLAEAQRLLTVLKDKVKAGFKRLAFEYHPDRTGNDPVKTAKFKIAATLKDDVEKLQVKHQPPPQPVPFVQVVYVTHYYPQSTATTTSSTFTGSTYARARRQNPWAATTMHPSGVGGTRVR